MTFGDEIARILDRTSNKLEIGSVYINCAYLYASDYEIVLQKINKRKAIGMAIFKLPCREMLLEDTGTLSHVAHLAISYVKNNSVHTEGR